MPQFIRNFDNRNAPIVPGGQGTLPLSYFNVLRLARGERATLHVPGFETAYVVMSGCCDIDVDGRGFPRIGRRGDIWSGRADSVYASSGASVTVEALKDGTEVAVAGGRCARVFEPFRVTPEEVDMVDVGSPETHSHRRIHHILGHNAEGRAGNLLVSELYADDGCWSGYPPHKHDTDQGKEETGFEEAYHYRFNPETGFGAQFVFQPSGESECHMVRHGDTVLIDRGYHPTVTSPGHRIYIFTILVGHTQRSLVQNFKEEHRHLMDKIPGIGAMRDKFK